MARKKSLQMMREVLIERRDALRQAIAGDDSLLKELSQRQGGDEVDFALDCAHGEISSQLAEVESRELACVENALKRFEDGTYGKCEACTRSIPLARLQALPYATCCIDCKRKAEEAGVQHGAVVDWSLVMDKTNDDLPTLNDLDFKIS